MTERKFKNRIDGLINDYEEGISTSKELRDGILDTLTKLVSCGDCMWSLEDEYNDPYYETNCGNAFQCMNGDYKHNHFTHCPFCGKTIKSENKRKISKQGAETTEKT